MFVKHLVQPWLSSLCLVWMDETREKYDMLSKGEAAVWRRTSMATKSLLLYESECREEAWQVLTCQEGGR